VAGRRTLRGAWLAVCAASTVACQRGPEAIAWERSHDAALSRAASEHKPVLLDFTADWCQACQELEHRTYVDPAVRREAARFVAVKLDATAMDDPIKALFERYGIVGLPAVIFVDSTGKVLERPRVTGFVEAPRFRDLMASVK
jgi:thiol:disulfide interchange protein DsbD